MSYCVNCGVELDDSLKSCPLCNTPVYNPNKIDKEQSNNPFPQIYGQVEEVKRKDWAILLSSIFMAISVTCGLLNFLAFNESVWSLLVIGVCIILWVAFIPAVIYPKINPYIVLLLDGLSVVLYLYMITFMTHSKEWYLGLALPITVLVIILLETFYLVYRIFPRSILGTILSFFIHVAVACVGIEIMIRRYLCKPLLLTWSAIVLTVCMIMIILLATLLSRKRLRNAVRRRLHF